MNQDTLNYLSQNLYAIIFAFLCLVFLIVSLTWKGIKNPVRLRKRVSAVLRRFALLRRFKVLDNLTLSHGGKTVTVDHVLVGHFGLLLVTDLVGRGDYYGQLDDKQWVCNTFNKREEATLRVGSYPNPLTHNEDCAVVIREILSTHKIFGMAIDGIAVSTHNRGDFLVTGGTKKAFNLRGLSPYLEQERLSADKGVDVDKISEVLSSHKSV